MRFVGYRQAERDCERLAERLLASYSRDDLRAFAWTAIPRGGLIVLGMLSYALALDRSRLLAGPEPGRPLAIVDDCALTGARFAAELGRHPERPILFAHLYSHPDLRRAIELREERVERCVAAHDLADRARDSYPEAAAYEAWRERWRLRLGAARYWLGQPELVCFAWSEPERPFWNEASGRVEEGWRFLSPGRCLAHRAALGPPPIEGARPVWRAPDGIASGEFDGCLWLYAEGRIYSLEGAAADMWRALAAWGDPEAAVAWLAGRYEVGLGELAQDLADFAERLEACGLLEPA